VDYTNRKTRQWTKRCVILQQRFEARKHRLTWEVPSGHTLTCLQPPFRVEIWTPMSPLSCHRHARVEGKLINMAWSGSVVACCSKYRQEYACAGPLSEMLTSFWLRSGSTCMKRRGVTDGRTDLLYLLQTKNKAVRLFGFRYLITMREKLFVTERWLRRSHNSVSFYFKFKIGHKMCPAP
jgi:hypothetical protein